VQSRIDVHCHSDYTSGKKITVYPLNIVYSRRLNASYRVLARDRIATIAAKILLPHKATAQNSRQQRSAHELRTSRARNAASRRAHCAIEARRARVHARPDRVREANVCGAKNFSSQWPPKAS
jgi:hypothetical protein